MDTSRLDIVFAALAHPARREMLRRLAEGPAGVMELAEPFEMSQPAVSKHIRVLEEAGLVSRGRDARKRPCYLETRPFTEVIGWFHDEFAPPKPVFPGLGRLMGRLLALDRRLGAGSR